MLKFVEKARQKTPRERKRLSFVLALVFTSIVVIFWLIAQNTAGGAGLAAGAGTEGIGPLESLLRAIKTSIASLIEFF